MTCSSGEGPLHSPRVFSILLEPGPASSAAHMFLACTGCVALPPSEPERNNVMSHTWLVSVGREGLGTRGQLSLVQLSRDRLLRDQLSPDQLFTRSTRTESTLTESMITGSTVANSTARNQLSRKPTVTEINRTKSTTCT